MYTQANCATQGRLSQNENTLAVLLLVIVLDEREMRDRLKTGP